MDRALNLKSRRSLHMNSITASTPHNIPNMHRYLNFNPPGPIPFSCWYAAMCICTQLTASQIREGVLQAELHRTTFPLLIYISVNKGCTNQYFYSSASRHHFAAVHAGDSQIWHRPAFLQPVTRRVIGAS
jgi:hypothetical protein